MLGIDAFQDRCKKIGTFTFVKNPSTFSSENQDDTVYSMHVRVIIKVGWYIPVEFLSCKVQ